MFAEARIDSLDPGQAGSFGDATRAGQHQWSPEHHSEAGGLPESKALEYGSHVFQSRLK